MEKSTLLVVLPALVAVMAGVALVRGVVSKRPPGQRGLVGTGLEDSRGLYAVQMAALLVLLLACIAAIVAIVAG